MLMTEREALHTLGITRVALLELEGAGKLKRYFRQGRHGRFARVDVYALCEGRLPPPLPAGPPPPRRRDHSTAHLYAIEILRVGTKVGITQSPNKRLPEHFRAAEDFGRRVGRVWVSAKHPEAADNERRLSVRGGVRNEFLRAGFDVVMRRIERLPMTFGGES